jgi:hypothetical protein
MSNGTYPSRMVFTNAFYAGYDTNSVYTPTDVVDGTVSVIMVSLYCGVGVYSHRLAYRGAIHQCLRIILNSDSKHDP